MNDPLDDELIDEEMPLSEREPLPLPEDAKEAVERWSIEAVGQKPEYYMARDFQFGSLFRDARPRGFHKLSQNPLSWMKEIVNRFYEHEERIVQNSLSLMFLHAQQLVQNVQSATSQEDPDDYLVLLQRMLTCPPVGLLLKRSDGEKCVGQDVCQLRRLCPWCMTRAVLKLHQRLENLVQPEEVVKGRYLFLGKVTVLGEQVAEETELQFGKNLLGWVRHVVGGRLRKAATKLGIRDGLLTYQLGPQLARRGTKDAGATFRHELGVLGTRLITSKEQIIEVRREIGAEGKKSPSISVGEGSAPVRWWAMPLDSLALRMLLVGSSHGYPTQKLELIATAASGESHKARKDGIPGVFQLQPLFMLNPEQWWAYVAATQRFRLFDAFGDWRHVMKKSENSVTTGDGKKEDGVIAKQAMSTRTCVTSANAKRQTAALARHQELLSKVRPLWLLATEQTEKRQHGRGRPSVRARLKQLLEDQQISVTDWELKKVIQALREEKNLSVTNEEVKQRPVTAIVNSVVTPSVEDKVLPANPTA